MPTILFCTEGAGHARDSLMIAGMACSFKLGWNIVQSHKV